MDTCILHFFGLDFELFILPDLSTALFANHWNVMTKGPFQADPDRRPSFSNIATPSLSSPEIFIASLTGCGNLFTATESTLQSGRGNKLVGERANSRLSVRSEMFSASPEDCAMWVNRRAIHGSGLVK